MSVLNNEIRQFLKEKRERKGWSQEKMANESFGSDSLGKSYISKVENGKITPGIENLDKMFSALKVKIKFEEY